MPTTVEPEPCIHRIYDEIQRQKGRRTVKKDPFEIPVTESALGRLRSSTLRPRTQEEIEAAKKGLAAVNGILNMDLGLKR